MFCKCIQQMYFKYKFIFIYKQSFKWKHKFYKLFCFTFADLKQEIAKILKISDPTRVEEISNALQKDGLKAVDELRFYDWKSLETLGVLSTKEINEIMEVIKGGWNWFQIDFELISCFK